MGTCISACYGGGLCGPCAGFYDPALSSAQKDKKDFSYEGKRFLAKVVDVYDGDTIRVKFRPERRVVQLRARMAGYDSPEMKPKVSSPNRAEEKKAAITAKEALFNKIGNQMVYIHCNGNEKFGRLLITVRLKVGCNEEGENVNEWMVKNGYGYEYDGGTKKAFAPKKKKKDEKQ